MNLAKLLEVVSVPVLVAWAAMIFAPRARLTRWLLHSDVLPLGIALLYGLFVVPRAGAALASFRTFDGIAKAFTDRTFVFAGWIHYLAFDLLVGRVVLADAQRRGLAHLAVVPSLLATFLFGPLGYLLYAATRLVTGRMGKPVAPLPPGDSIERGGSARVMAGVRDRFVRMGTVWGQARAVHPLLAWVTLSVLVAAVGSTALIFLDPRQVLGVATWIKPTKFLVSTFIYGATLLWLAAQLRGFRPALVRRVLNVSGIMLALEMIAISGQVVRGTRSHFNAETAFDGAVSASMGMAIVALWISNIVLAVAFSRERSRDRVLGSGIRLGLVTVLIGMASGFLMFVTGPGHTVGAPDGGPGLPFLNWSTVAGDWRAGHFVGLHGLQVIPAIAYFLSKVRSSTLTPAMRLALTRIAAGMYLGVTFCLLIQAGRGQSVIAPDAITLASFGTVLLVGACSALLVWMPARRPQLLRELGPKLVG